MLDSVSNEFLGQNRGGNMRNKQEVQAIAPEPSHIMKLSRQVFKAYRQPCVYLVFKGAEALYVGYSAHGLKRVFTAPTIEGKRIAAFAEGDNVEVLFYTTIKDASLAEAFYIHFLHPRQNSYCPSCSFYPKTMPPKFEF